uniref:Peptidase metallopeptidase domain-containing protein n=1 Tax=Clytia hemisphaerica TaxID=252671 RepID=A0A7M5WV55_9CNID
MRRFLNVLLVTIFYCLVLFLKCFESLPVTNQVVLDHHSLVRLKQWGYISSDDSEVKSNTNPIQQLRLTHKLVDALKTFQRFAYLEPTGRLDNATREKMAAPRCGMPDVIPAEIKNRIKKRFAAQGSKWQNRVVTWQLENTNNDGLTVAQVREYMTRSLKKWSDAANIDFREIPPTPAGPQAPASQIRVQFGQGNHGDQFPFDGPSGTLAHAFFPLSNVGLSGDIHFDDAERYTILDPPRSSGLIKFYWVAVHELGHSLGLSHSELFGAIMYPFYTHFPGLEFNLTQDDILGIQSIYGEKSGAFGPSAPPSPFTTLGFVLVGSLIHWLLML